MAARLTLSPLTRMYSAGVVLGAVATHLASEFFSMGTDADAHVAVSPRHLYLAVAVLVCLAILLWETRRLVGSADNGCDLRRLITNDIATLPLGGGGRFLVLTACMQIVIGIGTALGEGCLFCGHDVVFGIAGAVVTAFLLAIAGRLIALRLPSFAAEMARTILPATDDYRTAVVCDLLMDNPLRMFFNSLQLANRPPPVLS